MKNEPLVQDIIGFLRQSIVDGTVSSDDKESLEVAIECIADSFGVEAPEASNALLEVYSGAAPKRATSSQEDVTFKTVDMPVDVSVEVSEEDIAAADQLKLEGNRFMAQKNFAQAIDSYSQAIAKNPTNALYYSNRSAAYSQANQAQRAVEDAQRAVELDPTYAKGYSRLGLALYSVGNLEGSLKAYEEGLLVEGDNTSEGMRRGYDTVKKRIEETRSGSVTPRSSTMPETPTQSTEAASSEGAGGFFGGMPSWGSLGELMNNPEIKRMAQNLMSNPSAMNEILNNPTAQKVRERFANGKGPNFSELMSDPNISNLMNNYMNPGGKQ